ncbi:MAG: zinc-binding metallopeptidase family protein [Akkermansiaceae bacterium]
MKIFTCDSCNAPVYFDNIKCLSCESILGILPGTYEIQSFSKNDQGELVSLSGKVYKFCKNSLQYSVCNQVLELENTSPYCKSCEFTEITPNLSNIDNREPWFKLEQSKRRLLYSLNQLGISPKPKSQDAQQGLSFRFLAEHNGQEMTGHENGVITITIEEADDTKRVARREQFGEDYRTLLGHFRHEVGHYYWDVLISGTRHLEECRALFGDDRLDYGKALKAHYEKPKTTEWKGAFISHYATSHPWEDWAETFAHYLHLKDVLETSIQTGVTYSEQPLASSSFQKLMNLWMITTYRMNELGRSIGSGDIYPFIINVKVMEKMEFIHNVITEKSELQLPLQVSTQSQSQS